MSAGKVEDDGLLDGTGIFRHFLAQAREEGRAEGFRAGLDEGRRRAIRARNEAFAGVGLDPDARGAVEKLDGLLLHLRGGE